MLSRGFSNWWHTRLTPAGHVANIVFVVVIVGAIRALHVTFLIGLAIALVAGLILRPVFKRERWTYVKKR